MQSQDCSETLPGPCWQFSTTFPEQNMSRASLKGKKGRVENANRDLGWENHHGGGKSQNGTFQDSPNTLGNGGTPRFLGEPNGRDGSSEAWELTVSSPISGGTKREWGSSGCQTPGSKCHWIQGRSHPPTCSCVTGTVGSDEILSLSAGGGPVFSSCPRSCGEGKIPCSGAGIRHRICPRHTCPSPG